ncbi:MAG TPA: hypothetical protein ENG87_02755 [Candidatus Pacearchaeota archaeon]|nr:hypothetical protein [Candidatus Pacearchaeota archaeon]
MAKVISVSLGQVESAIPKNIKSSWLFEEVDLSKLPMKYIVLAAAPFIFMVKPLRSIVRGAVFTYALYRIVSNIQNPTPPTKT